MHALNVRSHWQIRRNTIELNIEKAALQLFERRGIDSVTIEEIAQTAGISRRTFFRYFQSRDDLLAATPTRFLMRSVHALRDRPLSEPIADALLAIAHNKIHSNTEIEILHLSAKVMARSPEAWIKALGPLRHATDQLFAEAISDRLRRRKQTTIHTDVVAAGLTAIIERTYWNWVIGKCVDDFGELLQAGLQRFSELASFSK